MHRDSSRVIVQKSFFSIEMTDMSNFLENHNFTLIFLFIRRHTIKQFINKKSIFSCKNPKYSFCHRTAEKDSTTKILQTLLSELCEIDVVRNMITTIFLNNTILQSPTYNKSK